MEFQGLNFIFKFSTILLIFFKLTLFLLSVVLSLFQLYLMLTHISGFVFFRFHLYVLPSHHLRRPVVEGVPLADKLLVVGTW